MSGGFSILGGLVNPTDSGIGFASITSSASANTKGAWTQLIASTANDTAFVMVQLSGGSLNSQAATDIGVGGAGSEQVLISNLVTARNTENGLDEAAVFLYGFPLYVPAGTRISARCQSNNMSNLVNAAVNLFDGSFTQSAGAIVEDIGFNAATTLGTLITPGNGSKGSYAQLTASTAHDYIGFGFGLQDNANNFNTTLNIDIAIGAGGSEKVVLSNFRMIHTSTTPIYLLPNTLPFMPIAIPAGTRIAAREQADGGTTAGPLITLYGVR